jgi:hypothetical protein
LAIDYSFDTKHLKWLSLTHLHPRTMEAQQMIDTISTMPMLTSLTLQVEDKEDSMALPSNSTLTSITILTPCSDGIRDDRWVNFSIVGELPNLRRLTLGSGIQVNQCMDDAVPCLETLSFGRTTPAST